MADGRDRVRVFGRVDGNEVEIEHTDHGVLMCQDLRGAMYEAYVEVFRCGGRVGRYELDADLLECAANAGDARRKAAIVTLEEMGIAPGSVRFG